jgi:hypothetical protein
MSVSARMQLTVGPLSSTASSSKQPISVGMRATALATKFILLGKVLF